MDLINKRVCIRNVGSFSVDLKIKEETLKDEGWKKERGKYLCVVFSCWDLIKRSLNGLGCNFWLRSGSGTCGLILLINIVNFSWFFFHFHFHFYFYDYLVCFKLNNFFWFIMRKAYAHWARWALEVNINK